MHYGLQLCIETNVLWPFKTKEEKEREIEDESIKMTITLDLDGDLGPWKQSQKLIPTALFRLKANNQHLNFANITAADMRAC